MTLVERLEAADEIAKRNILMPTTTIYGEAANEIKRLAKLLEQHLEDKDETT